MFEVRRPGGSLRAARTASARLFETLEARQLLSASPAGGTIDSSSGAAVYAALEAARPTITTTDPAPGKTGVLRNSPIAAYVNLPNVGHGVEESLLNSGVVKLYKTSDATRKAISATVNTTGGGDAIILTPKVLLDANTGYTFEVTSGLTDTSGAAFQPYKMSFTTGTGGAPTSSNFSFSKVGLSTATGHRFTGLTIGPDNRLYAGTMTGSILRWDIKPDGTLGSATTISTIKNGNGGQNRIITGVRFDPGSTASNLILWVTHGHGTEEGAPNWSGKLTRLSGSTLGTYQDYVTGLPRSVRDHLTNQIDFDSQNRLYISQASQNAMGAPDNAWGQRSEQLLSAAVLRVDYNAIASRIAAGQGAVNVKTAEGGTYNPYAAGAPVTLYATGVRNAYDLLWHSNGSLYAPTNGSAPGGNTPAGGGAPGLNNVAQNQPDLLFKIRKDKYYGHPNPTRGEYVLNGGNPTNSSDQYEVPAYPVGTQPDADWDPAVYSFGANRSPNGIIEYKSNAFGGALRGSMLVVRYSGGDDIVILQPDSGGNIPSGGVKTGVSGLTGFTDPLDIAEHVGPGNLYVIEHGAQKITLVKPNGVGTGGGGNPGPVREANTVYFNDPVGGPGVTRKLTIRNTGSSAVSITQFAIGGTDPSMFRVVSPPALPKSVAAGAGFEVTVEFNPPSGSALGLRKAELVATTSGGSQLKYALRALATAGETGANEPGLQRIVELFQRPIKVGDANPATSDMPLPLAQPNDSLNIQKFVKAGSGNVTIEPLAVFASAGTPPICFGKNTPASGSTTQVATFTDAQSVNPGLTSGGLSFDPGSGEFGLYTNASAFGSRLAYSQDAKNTWEPVSAARKKMLVFPLKDRDGKVVDNAFVIAWEEVSGGFDFQDFVAVIRNVRDPNAPTPTPTPTPTPVPGSGALSSLTLYNAVDDVAYGPLNDGDSVSHVQRNTWGFTIKAETSGTIGSVRWLLDGKVVATENYAPYAIGGDANGNLSPFAFSQGAHVVTAIAYSGKDGTGSQLGTIERSFTVTDTPNSQPPPPSGNPTTGVTKLTLMNAVDDRAYGELTNGASVSYVSLNTWGLTVKADVSAGVGSVRWTLDGKVVATENYAPFAIGGDDNGNLRPFTFAKGSHALVATAYSGRDGTGSVLGSITRSFTVTDTPTSKPPAQPNQPAGPGIKGLTLMNAVDDVAYGALADGATISYVSLNTWGLTIKADATAEVGSVRWTLDGGVVSTESYAPFAIGGDLNGGADLQPYKFTKGTHTLLVTAFTGRGGTGSVLNSVEVTFKILDQPL